VKVWTDKEIKPGESWPDKLAEAHARSRLFVPLLSRDYFDSGWCRLEWSLMIYRQNLCKLHCPSDPPVLIIPFVYDDGEHFPAEVQALQWVCIHEYRNPFVVKGSPTFERFTEFLMRECPRFEEALSTVPEFDPAWETVARRRFRELFRAEAVTRRARTQKTLPPLSP
jgi:hypothetical protein